jgi:hypothetical protein
VAGQEAEELRLRAEFAREVHRLVELYRREDAEAIAKATRDKKSQEAWQVALGLVSIEWLVNDGWRRALQERDLDRALETGVLEAKAILDALLTGQSHAVWKYIAAIQTGSIRSQRAAPAHFESDGRAAIVGLVRAYEQSAGIKRKIVAVRTVLAHYQPLELPLTVDQVRTWDKRLRDAKDPAPDTYAAMILQQAERLPTSETLPLRVLRYGQRVMRIASRAVRYSERSPAS